MHPATPAADRAIVKAVDDLERYGAELKTLRAGLRMVRLPIAGAEDRLDALDDMLACAGAQLNRASELMTDDFERILRDDDARHDGANDAHFDAAGDDRLEVA